MARRWQQLLPVSALLACYALISLLGRSRAAEITARVLLCLAAAVIIAAMFWIAATHQQTGLARAYETAYRPAYRKE